MTTIHFTSSDSFMEYDPAADEHAVVEIHDYLEATYCALRSGPDGDTFAEFINNAWELEDGRRFSDWAINV